MVAHSIAQDGIGFPHFSLACYWYIVGGEERAIEFVSVQDIGADAASVVSKVCLKMSRVLCVLVVVCIHSDKVQGSKYC